MESSSWAIRPRTADRFAAASSLVDLATAAVQDLSDSICCRERRGCLFLSRISPGCAVEFVFHMRTAIWVLDAKGDGDVDAVCFTDNWTL